MAPIKKNGFKKATREAKKLRAALIGPTGAGKTRTALEMAKAFGRVALIDSEHGSATMYADLVDFDHMELSSFAPERYIEAIEEAEAEGYDILIIDSLSHAWAGKDGILAYVDKRKSGDPKQSMSAWGSATPIQNRLVEKLLTCNLHLIVTLRSKMEHLIEKDEHGKTTVRKIGLQPVQRDGIEFEFDVICDIDQDNLLKVTKTRIDDIKGIEVMQANEALGGKIKSWLDAGAPSTQPPAPPRMATQDQKDTMKTLLEALDVKTGQGAYIKKLDVVDKLETYADFEKVNAELEKRVTAREAAKSNAVPTTTVPVSAKTPTGTPTSTATSATGDSRPSDPPSTPGPSSGAKPSTPGDDDTEKHAAE